MKALSCILIGGCYFLITSCQNDSLKKDRVISDSSATFRCEIYKGDTCNRLDYRGNKQGKWYIYDKQHQLKDTLYYKNGVLVEVK